MIEQLARILYDRYCKAVGGKSFNGDNLPPSELFFIDETKTKQADAWRETAKAAIGFISSENDYHHKTILKD